MNLNELNNGAREFTINIAGDEVKVETTAKVKETIKAKLEERGIDSFTIIIDGEEITSSTEIPETFDECDTVEVRRYVKAG
jgi:hypothetical protein